MQAQLSEKSQPVMGPRPLDWQDRELLTLARVWNRSDRGSRLEFLDMAKEAAGGIIDL